MLRSLVHALGIGKRRLQRRQEGGASYSRPLYFEALEERQLLAISVANAVTAKALVDTLLGPGVVASNYSMVYHAGAGTTKGSNSSSAGTFAGGTGILGIQSGVVLSSGGIANVIWPNTSASITQDNGMAGDANLNALIPGYQTYDATVLEFDFIPAGSKVTFRYVFGSDEYREFVNTSYNDVFAFFLNGANVALIPGTATPVSINNVNHLKNTQYYVNNDTAPYTVNTELDGLTTVLTVTATVKAGQLNHIKLAVADAGDHVLDSDVFIEAGSFQSSDLIVTGVDAGNVPLVKVYTGDVLQTQFAAYENTFRGGVRVAMGDVTGDGVPDIITAPGPGRTAEIRVFQGAYDASKHYTATLWTQFATLPPAYNYGGATVAVGDVNGDKQLDVIVGAGAGTLPEVRVFDGKTLRTTHALIGQPFNALESTFRGGVTLAADDLNGDGRAEIVVGRGAGGAPTVNIYQWTGTTFSLKRTFNAFTPSFTGGVFVATGDVDHDGTIDVVCGAGAGWLPQVSVFSGVNLLTTAPVTQLASFLAYDSAFRGGVRVTVRPDCIWLAPGARNVAQNLRLAVWIGSGSSPQTFDAVLGAGTVFGSFIA